MTRILRTDEVIERTGFSRSSIWRLERTGLSLLSDGLAPRLWDGFQARSISGLSRWLGRQGAKSVVRDSAGAVAAHPPVIAGWSLGWSLFYVPMNSIPKSHCSASSVLPNDSIRKSSFIRLAVACSMSPLNL